MPVHGHPYSNQCECSLSDSTIAVADDNDNVVMIRWCACSESDSTIRSSSPPCSGASSLPVAMTTPEAKRLRSSLPPQPKKKYQKVGLFSNCFKDDEYVVLL